MTAVRGKTLATIVAMLGCTSPLFAQHKPAPKPAVPAPSAPVPPPIPTTTFEPHPVDKVSVIVVSADTTPGDSVRVMMERDFNYGDRLDVVVLDSASHATLREQACTDSTLIDLAQYNVAFGVCVIPTEAGVNVTVYDVARRMLVHTTTMPLPRDSAGLPERMAVHRIADRAEGWMTGTPGVAATQIAYVAQQKIFIIDTDGANPHAVTAQGDALSPAWHPSGKSIVYSDLADAGTQIMRLNLTTGRIRSVTATRRGLNITPVYTPDGNQIAYATVGTRGSRLVLVDADGTGRPRALVPKPLPAIRDLAAPTFNPNGKEVAFVASLPMYPQVYTMHPDGSHFQRLIPYTPGLRNERTAPDWSPDGKMIAFQQQNRLFQVWIAQVEHGVATSVMRMTTIRNNEDPSWAPDSRHLVMTSDRGGDRQLWVFDTMSGRLRQLTTTGARLPAWGPKGE